MGIASYNKGSNFDIKFEDRTWVKLEDLYNEQEGVVFTIDGVFINRKSKFGPRPFIAFDKIYLADLPNNMLETVEEIIGNPDIVAQINEGKAGFEAKSYMNDKYNRECYYIKFHDIK